MFERKEERERAREFKCGLGDSSAHEFTSDKHASVLSDRHKARACARGLTWRRRREPEVAREAEDHRPGDCGGEHNCPLRDAPSLLLRRLGTLCGVAGPVLVVFLAVWTA